MQSMRAKRWKQLLLVGICLGGVQACGGGGGSDPLGPQIEAGIEQYALAVSPDGRTIATGGTYVVTTYSGAYPYGYDPNVPSGSLPPTSDPQPSQPSPGPVEDVPPDNSSTGDTSPGQGSSGSTDTPPDEYTAGQDNTDRKSRLRAARGGRASPRRQLARFGRQRAAATPTYATITNKTQAGLNVARGQALAPLPKTRYIDESLSGRIWFANPQTGVRIGGANLGQIVYALAFSPDGTLLASGSQDQRLRIQDAQTGVVLAELKGHGDRVSGVAFSPDGKRLASAGYNDHTIRLWDVASRAPQNVLATGSVGATAVAFAPDGATLAGSGGDGTVFIWDAQSGAVVHAMKTHKYAAFTVAYAPDGKTLASGSADNTVILWDPQAGTLRQTLTGHTGFVFGARFSPDGKLLATGSADQTVKLWDAHTGALLNTLSAPEPVQAVDFTPDSQTIVGAGVAGNLRAWDVTTGHLRWEQRVR